MPRNTRVILLSLAAAALVAFGSAWLIWLRPTIHRAHQVRTCADLQTYAQLVQRYREAHGRLPVSLSQAAAEAAPSHKGIEFYAKGLDTYGHPLLFETREPAFIIVSLGADGRPDGLDFWALRRAPPPPLTESQRCTNENADAFVADNTSAYCCGK